MIGNILKRLRAIYGYKANEMSTVLGISSSYLSELENNKKQPSLDILKKYSEIYGMKLSSLILLSENLDEAERKNQGDTFIRNIMLRLIDGMSKGVNEKDSSNA